VDKRPDNEALARKLQDLPSKTCSTIPKTFPGMLPFITLDHCYYESPLELLTTQLWRSKIALVASDHLPLLADFELP
jgi:endonuclease/exonuclease/phosphatase family metal-dependent hydrolase